MHAPTDQKILEVSGSEVDTSASQFRSISNEPLNPFKGIFGSGFWNRLRPEIKRNVRNFGIFAVGATALVGTGFVAGWQHGASAEKKNSEEKIAQADHVHQITEGTIQGQVKESQDKLIALETLNKQGYHGITDVAINDQGSIVGFVASGGVANPECTRDFFKTSNETPDTFSTIHFPLGFISLTGPDEINSFVDREC